MNVQGVHSLGCDSQLLDIGALLEVTQRELSMQQATQPLRKQEDRLPMGKAEITQGCGALWRQ